MNYLNNMTEPLQSDYGNNDELKRFVSWKVMLQPDVCMQLSYAAE